LAVMLEALSCLGLQSPTARGRRYHGFGGGEPWPSCDARVSVSLAAPESLCLPRRAGCGGLRWAATQFRISGDRAIPWWPQMLGRDDRHGSRIDKLMISRDLSVPGCCAHGRSMVMSAASRPGSLPLPRFAFRPLDLDRRTARNSARNAPLAVADASFCLGPRDGLRVGCVR